jgi:cysteine synthase A
MRCSDIHAIENISYWPTSTLVDCYYRPAIPTGIGQGRLTANLAPDLSLLSGAVHVPDSESIKMVYRLLDEEGLYVGASSALNVVAATMVAKKLGRDKTVVTMLCDGAYR